MIAASSLRRIAATTVAACAAAALALPAAAGANFQATIWRIPKGGGAPKIWFQSSNASPYIGVNGLRPNPAGTRIYVTVTVDMLGAASVYSLPLADKPPPASWTCSIASRSSSADGIAFGATGDLYVAMASPTAPGVMILHPDGTKRAQLTNSQGSLTAPYDGPAIIAFDGTGNILMTNHAPVTGLVTRTCSIVDTDVDDNGAPLFTPIIG